MADVRPFDLIVFDFDGVVAETELAANGVLADALTALGLPTSIDRSLGRYMGRQWVDCLRLITEDLGRDPPEGFKAACEADLRRRLEAELLPVAGLPDFLDRFESVPRCVASSSSPEWIAGGLERMGLADRFGGLFSARMVPRGKPAPDLFLFAASQTGVDPRRAVVIEDSPPGVQAGRAAGMTTVGLCAGAHIRPGHAERLEEAGAHRAFDTYAALADWIDAGAPLA